MINRVQSIHLGPPITLGEPVKARVGQAAAIMQRQDGSHEMYIVSNGSPAIFYTVDIRSGRILYQYEIPDSHAVWAMTIANNLVYFCGTDDGILYRYRPEEQRVESVGSFPSGPFVWDLCASAEGSIYGGTYPEAQLFEYNPQLNQFRDLGRMDSEQYYVRGTATIGDDVFAGIGSEIHLVQYNLRTGAKKELHLEGYTGQNGFISRIYPASKPGHLFIFTGASDMILYNYWHEQIIHQFEADGYISAPSPDTHDHYYISGTSLYAFHLDTLTSTLQAEIPLFKERSLIKAMYWMAEEDNRYTLAIVTAYMDVAFYRPDEGTCQVYSLNIPPHSVGIQSLEWDGGERLYIGGYHRGLTVHNTTTGLAELCLPKFPQIEGIGFLNRAVYFGTYTKAIIYRYDPDNETAPSLLFPIGHHQDRPFAVKAGSSRMFFGTIADYGLLSGALAMYDTETDKYEVYPEIVPNQSIIGLAYRHGFVYGGTTIWGGLGVQPSETEAKLFIWDVERRKLLHSFTPDIPGIDIPPRMIGELTFGPDGLLWGAADGTIFALCTDTLKVVKSRMIFPSEYKYSHLRPYFLRWGSDGLLYTALARKLVVIDPESESLDYAVLDDQIIALMTLGPDGHLYYNDGPTLIKRKIIGS